MYGDLYLYIYMPNICATCATSLLVCDAADLVARCARRGHTLRLCSLGLLA